MQKITLQVKDRSVNCTFHPLFIDAVFNQPVLHPKTEEVFLSAGQRLTPELYKFMDSQGIKQIFLDQPLVRRVAWFSCDLDDEGEDLVDSLHDIATDNGHGNVVVELDESRWRFTSEGPVHSFHVGTVI